MRTVWAVALLILLLLTTGWPLRFHIFNADNSTERREFNGAP